jgi:hypothetical protein
MSSRPLSPGAASAAPPSASAHPAPSRRALWAGRLFTGIAVLFLVADTLFKLAATSEGASGMVELGWPADLLVTIGLIELVCLVVYLVPQTAPLGAVLWTGYLGGAIATHLRLENPLFTHTLFPVYIAALVWGGLYLRDDRLRAMFRSAR